MKMTSVWSLRKPVYFSNGTGPENQLTCARKNLYLDKEIDMVIERDNQNIIIKLDASLIDIDAVQKFADYFRVLESNAKNRGTQEHADNLAMESHLDWLNENKDRLSKL